MILLIIIMKFLKIVKNKKIEIYIKYIQYK